MTQHLHDRREFLQQCCIGGAAALGIGTTEFNTSANQPNNEVPYWYVPFTLVVTSDNEVPYWYVPFTSFIKRDRSYCALPKNSEVQCVRHSCLVARSAPTTDGNFHFKEAYHVLALSLEAPRDYTRWDINFGNAIRIEPDIAHKTEETVDVVYDASTDEICITKNKLGRCANITRLRCKSK